jgi:L-alanine-DL-glutamate epimerase-like enolase superfamily enzyme
VVVKISQQAPGPNKNSTIITGRGEAVPYARYGETIETVTAAIDQITPLLARDEGISRAALQDVLLPGAARNAVDCALWDLQAQLSGQPVWQLAGLKAPETLLTAYTLTIDSPAAMARAASRASDYPLLKIKLGSADGMASDLGRLAAIRDAVPEARLVIDANEGWKAAELAAHAQTLQQFNPELIEQPLPAGEDDVLSELDLPFCADESAHDRETLAGLVGKYQWVNLKLDKTGGLTEALLMARQAKEMGFKLMTGCMVASSLSMAPAFILGQLCDLVDLDGPLLLEKDHAPGMIYDGAYISMPPQHLWGN